MSEAKQAINLSRANGQTAISLFYLPIALPYSAGLNAHVYEVLTMVYKEMKSSLKEHSQFYSFDVHEQLYVSWKSKNMKMRMKTQVYENKNAT